MTPDLGPPSSYLALTEGVPVYASDGARVGSVEHVLAAEDADIFDGLVVRIGGRRAFADATLVAGLYERGAVLTIDAGAVTRLPEPTENPPTLRATPDDTTPDGLAAKLRRAWDLLSGRR